MACSSLHTYRTHGLCNPAPGVTIPITAEVCRIQIAATDQHNRAIDFLPAGRRARVFPCPCVRRVSIPQALRQDVLQGLLLQGTPLSRIIRDVEVSLQRIGLRRLRVPGMPAHDRNRRYDHNHRCVRSRLHSRRYVNSRQCDPNRNRQYEPLCHHGRNRRYEGNQRHPVRRGGRADLLPGNPAPRDLTT